MIDVDPRFRRRGRRRCFGYTTGIAILVLGHPGQTQAQNRHRSNRESSSSSHGSILCLAPRQPQADPSSKQSI
jgi:hypothetical protein